MTDTLTPWGKSEKQCKMHASEFSHLRGMGDRVFLIPTTISHWSRASSMSMCVFEMNTYCFVTIKTMYFGNKSTGSGSVTYYGNK